MTGAGAPLVLGWREEASFPDWGISGLKVKLDTGARTSAVHARRVTEVGTWAHQGRTLPVIELELPLDREPHGAAATVRVRSLGTRSVRDTRDRAEVRHVVSTRLVVGSLEKEIEISVTDRTGMLFRVLLGRTALAGDVLVDPARSYTTRHEGHRRT